MWKLTGFIEKLYGSNANITLAVSCHGLDSATCKRVLFLSHPEVCLPVPGSTADVRPQYRPGPTERQRHCVIWHTAGEVRYSFGLNSTYVIVKSQLCCYCTVQSVARMCCNVACCTTFVYDVFHMLTTLKKYIAHYPFYYSDRPVQSDTLSTSLGSIQPYATINAWRLLVHISTTVYSQVLIYRAVWTRAMQSEKTCPRF